MRLRRTLAVGAVAAAAIVATTAFAFPSTPVDRAQPLPALAAPALAARYAADSRPGGGDPMTRTAGSRIRDLAARIDAATPPDRDRTVDALRALAIIGVILGHWMVTALVLTNGRTGKTLHDASPLASLPP